MRIYAFGEDFENIQIEKFVNVGFLVPRFHCVTTKVCFVNTKPAAVPNRFLTVHFGSKCNKSSIMLSKSCSVQ